MLDYFPQRYIFILLFRQLEGRCHCLFGKMGIFAQRNILELNMITRKLRCTALTALLAMLWLTSHSQTFIRHEFEGMLGTSASFRQIDGDERRVTFVNMGPMLSTRYSFFADQHFGVFAQIEFSSCNSDQKRWFGAVNKADGEKYLYRFRNYGQFSESSSGLFAGAAFRFSINELDITSRLGAGIMEGGYECSYERRSRDGSTGPQYYDVRWVGRKSTDTEDYLIENEKTESNPNMAVLKADIRFSMPHKDRIGFMFVNLGADIPLSKMTREITVRSSSREHDPQNWVESVAWADAADNWIMDDTGTTTRQSIRLQPTVSISVGYCFTVIKSRR